MKKYILSFLLLSSLSFGLVSAQTVTDNVTDSIDCATITHNLKLGSRDVNTGGDVTTLQLYLSQANFLDSDPTGYFGRATRKAVQDFQLANGISNTGNVGPLTRGKIGEVSCGGSNIHNTSVNTQVVIPIATVNQATTNTSVNNTITSSGNSNAYVASAVNPVTALATIDQSTLINFANYPTFSGSASGVNSVILFVYEKSTGDTLLTYTSIPVVNGRWSYRAGTERPRGSYIIQVIGVHDTLLASAVYFAPDTSPTATLDQSFIIANSGTVTFAGSAYNTNAVFVALVKADYSGSKDWATIYTNHSYAAFDGSIVTYVTNNKWTESLSGLQNGNYTVLVYDNSGSINGQVLLANGTLTVAVPTISITASSLAVSPAMTMSVSYNNMPATGLHIMNSSGVTVWTQELTAGGSGSTVVSLPSVLPAGNYTAQAFGSDGRVYATSDVYYFIPPLLNYTVSYAGQSVTFVTGQSATDGGLKITLNGISNDLSSGQMVANLKIETNGYVQGVYLTAAGSVVGGGAGFPSATSPNGSATITVTSLSSQSNSATILIKTAIKG